MMTDFFLKLRQAGIPVTLTEFLTLLEALSQRVTCLLYTSRRPLAAAPGPFGFG